MPEFSVIVPVYKAEKYLGCCIESVLNQTVTDFEMILVDDGSPDNSGAICDAYAEKDDRVRVIHQSNGGVSVARNAGLQAAKGQYAVFIDSDDEVDADYLECMQEYSADLVITGITNYSVDGSIHHRVLLPQERIENVTAEEVCKMIEYNALDFSVSKRYLLEHIRKNGIFFKAGMHLSEDTLFSGDYLSVCSSVQYVAAAPYRYYKYDTKTLSSFTADYPRRQIAADNMVGAVLERHYPGILGSDAWKRRRWSIFHYSIFYVLREWDVSFAMKCKTLQQYFSMPEYQEYTDSLDHYMQDDAAIWRRLLRRGDAVLLLLVWKAVQLREKIRGKNNGR